VGVAFLLPRVRFPFTSVNAMSAADRAGGKPPASDARRVLRRTAVRAACSSAAASTSSTDMGTGTAGAEDAAASSKMANDDDDEDDAGGAGGATAGKSTAPPLSSTMSASARPRAASSAMWVATMPCSSAHCGSRVASPRFVVARPFVGAGFGAANDALFSIPVRGIRAAVDAIDPAASLNVAQHNEKQKFNGYKKAESEDGSEGILRSKQQKDDVVATLQVSCPRCSDSVPAF